MRELEGELIREFQKNEREFYYKVSHEKILFQEEAKLRHRKLIKRFHRYILDSKILICLTRERQ